MRWVNANSWSAVLTAALLGFNLVGCGGGGGDDGNSSPPPQAQSAPAPAKVGGQVLTVYSASSVSRDIVFNTDDMTWSESRETSIVMGTYRYSRQNIPGSAELILTGGDNETSLLLTFNTPTSGSYVYSDQSGQGTFTMQAAIPTPGTGGSEIPPHGDLAADSLAGRTMYGTRTFTSTGPVGQTHVYTFAANTFHDSDPPEESDGSYVYQPSGNTASIVFSYQSPAGFNGDRHELQLTFQGAEAGAFESVYTRRDGTVIRIDGTFTLE